MNTSELSIFFKSAEQVEIVDHYLLNIAQIARHLAEPKMLTSTLPSDGVWVDPKTDLMWSRINIGQKWLNGECYGEASALDWKQAQESCKIFNLAGFRDWRLPSIEELRTLVQQNKAGYSCSENMLFKPTERAWGDYWSSSFHSYFDDNTFVWYLNFNSTESSNSWEIISRYVRLVRNNK